MKIAYWVWQHIEHDGNLANNHMFFCKETRNMTNKIQHIPMKIPIDLYGVYLLIEKLIKNRILGYENTLSLTEI